MRKKILISAVATALVLILLLGFESISGAFTYGYDIFKEKISETFVMCGKTRCLEVTVTCTFYKPRVVCKVVEAYEVD